MGGGLPCVGGVGGIGGWCGCGVLLCVGGRGVGGGMLFVGSGCDWLSVAEPVNGCGRGGMFVVGIPQCVGRVGIEVWDGDWLSVVVSITDCGG